jgi:hypothetical protein
MGVSSARAGTGGTEDFGTGGQTLSLTFLFSRFQWKHKAVQTCLLAMAGSVQSL